ncbi:MAG: CotH kinase family protein [Verrucomicrobiota bacterium]
MLWWAVLGLAGSGRMSGAGGPPVWERSGWGSVPRELAPPDASRGLEYFLATDGSVPTRERGRPWTTPWVVRSNGVVRVAAYRGAERVGAVETRTFLFPEAVGRQTGAGLPPAWGSKDGRPVPADYAMDPEVTQAVGGAEALAQAWRAMQVLSLALEPADLWDEARGLYAHPEERGEAWERPVAVELLPEDGTTGFRVEAGLRIQGGWNRRPEESPKHSFRLVFRRRYGPGRLEYPLFGGGPGGGRFETLVLRAGNNHSWLHWSAGERQTADYLRDEWVRRTHAAMGGAAPRGRFVHLFLNGLYWGLYNLVERPDEHFAAVHLGGAAADYEARNADKVLAGDDQAWEELWRRVETLGTPPGAWTAVGELLDLPQFCDYLLLHLYAGNGDWDGGSNWYALRRRNPGGRFQFVVWDAERTLERVEDNRLADDFERSPMRLFQRLRSRPEFRRLLAAQARKHLAAEGVLGAGPAGEWFRRLAGEIEAAVVAESARWGDYRLTVHPYREGRYERYTREDHWRPEIRRLLEDYFPRRPAAFRRQLTEAGLLDP